MRGKHFTCTMKRLAGVLLFMAAVLLPVGQVFAAYNVNISGDPSANGAWSETLPVPEVSPSVWTWTPNGNVSNVSVVDILTKLNVGGVTITDAGNINVNATLSWSTNTLTLTANNDININAVISASNTADLKMNYGWNGATYGNQGGIKVGFAPGEANGFLGRVDFSGSGILTINGDEYTVINNVDELQGIRNSLAGKYALGADIDASDTGDLNGGVGFLPIGDNSTEADDSRFTGVFDGLGHTINGLIINQQDIDKVGLFGHSGAESGTVILRNVGLVDGNVSGQDFVGGLAGYSDGVITNSYNSGVVSGRMNVGGMVGHNYGAINNIYAAGAVSGIYSVGSLVGTNDATISNSYATGSVTGNIETGGLVGINLYGLVINSYSTGRVIGGDDTGGLVGYNFSGNITNSYSTGIVSGASNVGGLVGYVQFGTVTNSFWDTQTSGQTSSAGDGIGKPTTDMKQLSTFYLPPASWDIDATDSSSTVWRITEGQSYPLLRTFIPPLMATSGSATGITTTSATLNGMVNASHSNAAVSFEYGLTTAYGTSVAATPASVLVGSGDTAVSAAISGLTPGQTYHYRVVATNSIGTDYGEDTVFTAPQLSQTISGFSPPATATFGDAPITLSASSVLPVVFSVTSGPGLISDNKFLHITGAGTIVLRASQPGSLSYSAAPNVTASITVNKAAATVTLGSLSHIYSGTAKAATASTTTITNPPLVINITYDGSATAPTDAGTYAVDATINDPNYIVNAPATGTLTIAKATPTINWATPADIYQGTALSATQLNATASVSGTFAYTPEAGTILPIDNSNLSVAFTPADISNYYSVNASASITVKSKLDPIINWVTPSAMVYGTALSAAQLNASASVSVIDNTNVPGSFVYTSAAGAVVTAGTILNAGTQPLTFTFTPVDTATYNNVTDAVILTINKAVASVNVGNQTQTYTGSALTATIATTPAGLNTTVTYVDNATNGIIATAPKFVGTYAVFVEINDINYSGSASGTLTITKATTTVTLDSLSQPYDGAPKSAIASTSPSNLAVTFTYNGSANLPTEIGSYQVVGTISDNNYQGSTTATLVITPPALAVAIAGTGTGTVTSSPAGLSCSKSSAADVTCTNTFSGTVSLYATPSVLSLFKGWGGACGGLGACSFTMGAGQTVTATFDLAPLLHIDGTIYPSLQAAYDAAPDGSFIQLLDNTVAGTLDANRSVTVKLKGGYDAGYTNNTGTTALTAPLTIRLGTLVIDRIVIK